MLTFRAGVAVLIAGLCTGCATTGATLDPAEFRRRTVSPSQRFALESEGEDRGFIEIATGGAFVTQLGARRMRVLHVRLTVRNGDADALRLPLDQLAVEGIGGNRLRPAAIFADREENTASVVVPPGEVRATDVVFALPYGMAVDEVSEFSLFWGVDVPGDVIRKATVFTPADPGEMGATARTFRPSIRTE
jgi:hypothetical protein